MTADNVITVAPSMLRLRIGEVRQIQVITDYDNVKVVMEPEGLVEWDKIHREFKGLKRGYCNIRFDAYDTLNEKEVLVGSDHIAINISEEELKSTIRYMWHNRATNRLVTIEGSGNENEDLIFKLPKKTGKLVTDTTIDLYDTIISTPTITSPETDITNYDGIIKASDFKLKTVMASYPHTGTTWQVASDENFNNILKEEYVHGTANNPLTSTSFSYYGITTYVRLKYHSNSSYSNWSEPIKITWTTKSPDGECSSVLTGDVNTTAYFGAVNESSLIDNRDYRGNWQTLMTNNIKAFTIGQQVTHKNKLWYAPVALTTTTGAIEPGTNETSWVEDTREKLPTVRWLMDRVGIGLGNTDNNIDTYTSDGVKVGEQINKNNNRWLKFVHKGKLFYTTAKSICGAISWCDVARRNAVYGNRTVLIGSRVYRIRLLTEEEYNACFITLPEQNADLKANIELVDNNLIEDFREGPKRYVIKQNGTKSNFTAGSRTCNYRPVLELIRKGDEPFNKIPKCAEAEDENFRYDPYTDTGYFGLVKDSNSDLVSTEELMLFIKWTNGNRLHVGNGYWKFYFHGIVKYITRGMLRNYTNAKVAIDNNFNYMCDMGNGNKLEFNKSDVKYIPSNISGVRNYPINSLPNSLIVDDCEFSLFYRICKDFINLNYTNQIGDNWEENTIEKIFITSCEWHIQEVMSGNTSYMYFYNTWPNYVHGSTSNQLDANDGLLVTLNVKTYETINE